MAADAPAPAPDAPPPRERPPPPGRVLRSRRYRRPSEELRRAKRLFTPDIKRFLKRWLLRRRDNPYPSRDEKKRLATHTGLTYVQICNWFANWRRKLKNAGSEERQRQRQRLRQRQRQRTWGHLIKSYNTQAQGNAEQFSICSDDSIWEEEEERDAELYESKEGDVSSCPTTPTFVADATTIDHCYSALYKNDNSVATNHSSVNLPQCSQISSTTEEPVAEVQFTNTSSTTSSKYKSHMMEKYLRDICTDGGSRLCSDSQPEERIKKAKKSRKDECQPLLLSKWLESAAKYQPGQSYVAWAAKNVTWRSSGTCQDNKRCHSLNISVGVETANVESSNVWSTCGHLREELDAAVALTRLSGLQH